MLSAAPSLPWSGRASTPSPRGARCSAPRVRDTAVNASQPTTIQLDPLTRAPISSHTTAEPSESAPGTIRGDFALDVGRNICHGSDAVESANREIALWCVGVIPVYGLWVVHSQRMTASSASNPSKQVSRGHRGVQPRHLQLDLREVNRSVQVTLRVTAPNGLASLWVRTLWLSGQTVNRQAGKQDVCG